MPRKPKRPGSVLICPKYGRQAWKSYTTPGKAHCNNCGDFWYIPALKEADAE